MKILHERFGSLYIICNSIISGLKDESSVGTTSELRSFADELTNAEITLKGKDSFHRLTLRTILFIFVVGYSLN